MKQYRFDYVTLYCRNLVKVENVSYLNSVPFKEFRHSFPVDLEKDHSTAKTWMESSHYGSDPSDTLVMDVDNKFEDPLLVSIEHRSNGGRAYTVAVYIGEEDLHVLFEIRDKVFEELLFSHSIEKGVIKGKFRFINDRGACLVPLNGLRDKNYRSVHESPPITRVLKKNLVIGKAYLTLDQLKNRSKIENISIYMGTCYIFKTRDLSNLTKSKDAIIKKRSLFLTTHNWSYKKLGKLNKDVHYTYTHKPLSPTIYELNNPTSTEKAFTKLKAPGHETSQKELLKCHILPLHIIGSTKEELVSTIEYLLQNKTTYMSNSYGRYYLSHPDLEKELSNRILKEKKTSKDFYC